jgi:predicted 3-demethylubiquinone-9 3-methyltransferase (glyoxalase superfamily)
LGESLREFWERNELCDQRKGLGSFYSEMDGQDCSKTITSNGWGEDLGRFGIKYQIFGDSVHESVSAESRSIAFLHYEIIDLIE